MIFDVIPEFSFMNFHGASSYKSNLYDLPYLTGEPQVDDRQNLEQSMYVYISADVSTYLGLMLSAVLHLKLETHFRDGRRGRFSGNSS